MSLARFSYAVTFLAKPKNVIPFFVALPVVGLWLALFPALRARIGANNLSSFNGDEEMIPGSPFITMPLIGGRRGFSEQCAPTFLVRRYPFLQILLFPLGLLFGHVSNIP